MADADTLSVSTGRSTGFFARLSWWQRFMIASLVIIAGGMAGIGLWVGTQIQNSVIHQSAAYTALYVSSIVEPHLQELASAELLGAGEESALRAVFETNEIGQHITAVRVLSKTGKVVYSTDPEDVGTAYAGKTGLTKALRGWVAADIVTAGNESSGRAARRLETYSPVRRTGSSDIIAAVEFYQTVDSLDDSIASAQRNSWLVVGIATIVMYLLLAGFVKRASDTIRNQQNELSTQVERLRSLLEQNDILHRRVRDASRRTSSTNERFLRRIGSELHDGPAQDIGLALLRLEHLAPEAAGRGADFELVQSSLQHALHEIRAISAGMSLPELESLDISETVSKAVRAHERRTGSTVAVSVATLPQDVSLATKMAVYRVIQESLGNAYRHARGIGQEVDMRYRENRLELKISDRGAGFGQNIVPDSDEHLGIVGMRERVESLGGSFAIESVHGQGTTVRACLPLDAPST